jgi:hypothetical protein
MRRWIEADKVPAPYLTETVKGYRVYTVGELETIVRHIARHEEAFVYLATQHTQVVEHLHQAVHAYRAQFI